VLKLLNQLIEFGYLASPEKIKRIVAPLTNLIDGRKDLEFGDEGGKGLSKHHEDKVITIPWLNLSYIVIFRPAIVVNY
jgi:hypothetical protein